MRIADHASITTRLDAIVQEFYDSGVTDSGRLGLRLKHALRKRAEDGEAWAQERLEMATNEGCRRFAVQALKRAKSSEVSIAHNGSIQKFTMPQNRALTQRRGDGSVEGTTRKLWTDMSRAEFLAMYQTDKEHLARLGVNIKVWDLVATCLELQPDALTPGEALRREGYDPDQFVVHVS